MTALGEIGTRFAHASAIFLVAWGIPAYALGESYRYVELHPPGWETSVAQSINESGEVAGYGTAGSAERGFLWSSGRFQEILPPGADGARANWVNGRGDVAGTAIRGGVPHAFLLRAGAYSDPTPGWDRSEALYVGEDGAVAGTGTFGAYISLDGAVEIFPGFSVVTGGNSSGQWIGSVGDSAGLFLPGFGYRDVTPPRADGAIPHGINESGLLAVSAVQDGHERGYVYSGGFFVSMTPPGWASSRAMAINDADAVAGYGDAPEGRRSFLRSGAAYEILAVPGWQATEARSVNRLGQVAGSGTTAEGKVHAFLAVPASGPDPDAGGCAVASRGSRGRDPGATRGALAVLGIAFLLLPRSAPRRRRRTSPESRKEAQRTAAAAQGTAAASRPLVPTGGSRGYPALGSVRTVRRCVSTLGSSP